MHHLSKWRQQNSLKLVTWGRDVESIIRDLMDTSMKITRESALEKVKYLAEDAAKERILDCLLPSPRKSGFKDEPPTPQPETKTRQLYREKLNSGALNDTEIEIEMASPSVGVEIMAPPGMEEMTNQLQGIFQNLGHDRKRKRKMKVKDALRSLQDEEAYNLIDEEELKVSATEAVEQNGIVFIDELDKVTRRTQEHKGGGDVSREGVQRDLLPIIEGCTVSTRHGMVKTDHILFIASGAFHYSKPSDLIAELQGRLPIRVELKALTVNDFVKILTEPNASLTEQYVALLQTEGVSLSFKENGIKRLAEIAWQVNECTENIGARRLHTVMERLLENLSFNASDHPDNDPVVIDAQYVDEHLSEFAQDEDLSQYIL